MRLLHVTLLLCAVMALTSAHCRSKCPAGWKIYHGRCYKYVAKHLHWDEAELNCLALCGNLVSISDKHEDKFVKTLVAAYSPKGVEGVWIGGHDRVKEGLWLWSDGTKMSHSNWNPGEPNNGGGKQDCMQMYGLFRGRLGKWDDYNCFTGKSSVCVKPASA